MTPQDLGVYLAGLEDKRKTGRASEHTYRTPFEIYLKTFNVEVLNDPNPSEQEDTDSRIKRPDFDVEREGIPIGHIECKTVGKNLDTAEKSEQMLRYRDAFYNLILTDYVEFRWYVGGERRAEGRLGRFDQDRFVEDETGIEKVLGILDAFLNTTEQPVTNPAELAERMAGKARFLRETILGALTDDADNQLRHYLKGYRETLIEGLTEGDFADLVAQTVVYGMFAARCLHRSSCDTFNLQKASGTKTTPLLEDVLNMVTRPRAHPDVKWMAEDIAGLLDRAKMKTILSGFGQRTKKQDPIIHFYEDFLDAYDPKKRKDMGVYYTPRPVVSYIVKSIDHLLRSEFGLQGLQDTSKIPDDGRHRVSILDPAVGTGTFLREVISEVRTGIKPRNPGGWLMYWQQHLLPRLFGFEFLMAPYAICHLALALEFMEEDGEFKLPADQRLNVYLTNTLKPQQPGDTLFVPAITNESRHADEVKHKTPVMVVLGNPPYKGDPHSSPPPQGVRTKEDWITKVLKGKVGESPGNYFAVDGIPLSETDRNTKWLHNSYIRFIRFAHWRIEQTGEGILGFITDNSYLDSVIARGMRQSLVDTFDSIWILNLHGNKNKKERAPDGGPDDNIFGIREGTSIGIFVKRADGDPGRPALVNYAELWAKLETSEGDGKFDWLAENDVNSHPESHAWTPLSPQKPHYLFVPHQTAGSDEYHQGWKLIDIFNHKSVGVTTGKDPIAIQFTEEDVRNVVGDFNCRSVEELMSRYHYEDITQRKVAEAKRDVRSEQFPGHVTPILFRPFDIRYTHYSGVTNGMSTRPRFKVMRHMRDAPDADRNWGLVSGRQTRHGCIAMVTSDIMGHKAGDRYDISYLFPLYLHPKGGSQGQLEVTARIPNLSVGFVGNLEKATGLRYQPDEPLPAEEGFGPKDVFGYIYAILHSPEYRRRYADFLRHDFPHIPLPPSRGIFQELASRGVQLTELHLLKDVETQERLPGFFGDGTYLVEQVKHEELAGNALGRVWINSSQYFEGVALETWETTVGGYQPARRWLEDRKGRPLVWDDLIHYEKLCLALAETRRIMQKIDSTIKDNGGLPLG